MSGIVVTPNDAKPSRFQKILDDGTLVHTEALCGRAFLVIYRARTSTHVAEIMPFEVSWSIDTDSDSNAIDEGKKLTKNYFQNLVDAVK